MLEELFEVYFLFENVKYSIRLVKTIKIVDALRMGMNKEAVLATAIVEI
jgi:hypothetical protein